VIVFVDTSAVYALLDASDSNHERALRATARLLGEELVTHSYVSWSSSRSSVAASAPTLLPD